MAKNKRPKWLDAENPELLNTLKEILGAEEISDKDQTKAQKIVDELIARIPTEDDTQVSVEEAIAAAKTGVENLFDQIKAAYDHEVSMIADTEEPEEEPEEEEEEVPAPKKSKKSKKSKKAAKVEEPEEEEDEEEPEEEEDEEEPEEEEDEEDDSTEDYSDWSTKELKKECRERGIKVTKSMGKAELVKALEADDKE